MKYVVVLGDGMADLPVAELGGRTPLAAARTPNMDALARLSELGMARTVPEGMPPASDVANLSVLGYDPRVHYTGRSPLEAVSLGLELGADDVAFRCNLVTLSEEGRYADRSMLDYSAGEIPTAEARELMAEVGRRLGGGAISFHPGISYRHCMIWKGGPVGCGLTPPHDISGRPVRDRLPAGKAARELLALMEESASFLAEHPVNRSRRDRGLGAANSIWLWGEGRKPAIPSFKDKYGVEGAMISAVDLLKGLALCAGLESVEVEGATGTIDTNFEGKARAALEALRAGRDFAYVHVEAPDECGHHGDAAGKVEAIERIDGRLLGPLLEGLRELGDFRLLLLPDHPTPIATRTHAADPVPFLLYDSRRARDSGLARFDEEGARSSGLFVEEGRRLMDRLLGRGPAAKGR